VEAWPDGRDAGTESTILMPFTPANLDLAREAIAKYPQKKSAVLPLLHLAQDQDGRITHDAIEEIADLLDLTPALVLGTCSFYSMYKLQPPGKLVVSVCTNVACIVNRAPELLHHLERHYADDADVSVEEAECLAACDQAPVMQVNYEFHGPVTPDDAVTMIGEYKSGQREARTISGSVRSSS
jgi:NADH-quinone oxidoreductase subunit E